MKRLLACILTLSISYGWSYAQDTIPVPDSSAINATDTIGQTEVVSPQSAEPIPVVVEIDHSADFMKDDFNLYGIIALVVGFISLVVAGITLWAQKKTEKHTQNAPISSQIGQFKDLTRHLYRNLVCTSAAILHYRDKNNLEDGNKKAYPSESNFQKLKTMPDDVILDIDANDRTYAKLHELRLLLRNYNVEIDVASQHISRQNICEKVLTQDFDNLLYKPLHLVKAAFEPESLLMSADSGLLSLPDRSIMIMIEEHFKKLKENIATLGKSCSQECLKVFFESSKTSDSNTEQESSPIAKLAEKYKSKIDSNGGLNRAFEHLVKARVALAVFDHPSQNEKQDEIIVRKEDFFSYLKSRDAEICSEIKKLIKDNKCRLFWLKPVAAVWPFNRDDHWKEVRVLTASVKKLEKKLAAGQGAKLIEFIKELSSISLDNGCEALFKLPGFKNYGVETATGNTVSKEALYNSLKPYLQYIREESWKFNDLLYLMLAIDISIEVNRIGMVNYE